MKGGAEAGKNRVGKRRMRGAEAGEFTRAAEEGI